jgi:hypothetical protein
MVFACWFHCDQLEQAVQNVVKFYSGRGTAERSIGDGKNAVKWRKLSCGAFKDSQTRLQLFALAYNDLPPFSVQPI